MRTCSYFPAIQILSVWWFWNHRRGGLPALVSNMGGPKEIIKDKVTGYVAKADDFQDWFIKLEEVIKMYQTNRDAFDQLCVNARERVLSNFNWDVVLEDLFTERAKSEDAHMLHKHQTGGIKWE